jgi:hypothetical protein
MVNIEYFSLNNWDWTLNVALIVDQTAINFVLFSWVVPVVLSNFYSQFLNPILSSRKVFIWKIVLKHPPFA